MQKINFWILIAVQKRGGPTSNPKEEYTTSSHSSAIQATSPPIPQRPNSKIKDHLVGRLLLRHPHLTHRVPGHQFADPCPQTCQSVPKGSGQVPVTMKQTINMQNIGVSSHSAHVRYFERMLHNYLLWWSVFLHTNTAASPLVSETLQLHPSYY